MQLSGESEASLQGRGSICARHVAERKWLWLRPVEWV